MCKSWERLASQSLHHESSTATTRAQEQDVKAILRVAFNSEHEVTDRDDVASAAKHDRRSHALQENLSPHENGALHGALATRDDDGDPLARLTRSLDRATAAGQWKVAEAIIRQIERIEIERAGNVVAIDVKRARK